MSYLLRLENFVIFAVLMLTYYLHDYSWILFLICFFIPDLALLGYLVNAKVGGVLYNITHSYIGAAISTFVGYAFLPGNLLAIGLIWLCHISFDRMLGYGLKYLAGFSQTHLGIIGRKNN